MRLVLLIAASLIVAGCSTVTYNCNVPGSCEGVPKAGVSITTVNGASPN